MVLVGCSKVMKFNLDTRELNIIHIQILLKRFNIIYSILQLLLIGFVYLVRN